MMKINRMYKKNKKIMSMKIKKKSYLRSLNKRKLIENHTKRNNPKEIRWVNQVRRMLRTKGIHRLILKHLILIVIVVILNNNQL